MKKLLALIIVLFVSLSSYSQQKLDQVNSTETFQKGIELFDNGNYMEALEQYQKIPENDTNYYVSLVEQVLADYKLEKYEDGVAVGAKALKLTQDLEPNLFLNMGCCLDNLKRYDDAVKLYEKGIELFPNYTLLYDNKAFSLNMGGKVDKAFAMLKQCMAMNPFHPRTHYLLGVIAMNEGKSSLAMMAFSMYLILKPGIETSNVALVALNDIASSKYTEKMTSTGVDITDGDDYSDIDALIANYAALNKKYKVPSKISLACVRQDYMLFDKLPANPDTKGFWYKTYVPFFKRMLKEKQFDAFANFLLVSSANDLHKKMVKKNMKKLTEFATWFKSSWDSQNRKATIFFKDKFQRMDVGRFNSGFAVSIAGTYDSLKKAFVGYTEAYNDYGTLRAKGIMNDEGKKEGEWTYYYDNKNLKEKDFYDNGKLDKYYQDYSELGILQSYTPVQNDFRNGEFVQYKTNGARSYTANYKDNVLDGAYKEYFSNGQLAFSSVIKKGKVDGKVSSWYPSGELKREATYVNGEIDGKETFYYRNGKVKEIKNYKLGKYDGLFLSYYDNGQVSDSSHYINNNYMGRYAEYSRYGVLMTQGSYDESGKKNGTLKEYNDGKLFYELEYKKGEIIGYTYYNIKGEVIKQDKKKSGSFDYEGFYQNGNLRSKGVYTKEDQEGEWIYYDFNGLQSSKVSYTDGKRQGEDLYYYPNQKTQKTLTYKDDDLEGYYAEYYKNGNISVQGYYKKDEQDGPWIEYYPDKTISDVNFYLAGDLHGIQKHFAPGGKLFESSTFYKGVMTNSSTYDTTGVVIDSVALVNASGAVVTHTYKNGPVRYKDSLLYGGFQGGVEHYYPNKQLLMKGQYFVGDRNGKFVWYYADGTVETKGEYAYGKACGKWQYYDEDGKITSETMYRSGTSNYKTTYYWDNGKVKREQVYKDGDPDSTAVFYTPEGAIEHKRFYKEGNLVAYSYFDASNVEKKIDILNGTADVKVYFKNGKLSRQFSTKDGWFEGDYLIYNSAGKLIYKTFYLNDEINGDDVDYYSDGTLKEKATYYYGELNGKQEKYYSNGKLRETAVYVYGKLQGPREFYNKAGKLIMVMNYFDDVPISVINK